MPDKFFLSASGADPVGTVQGLLQGLPQGSPQGSQTERVLWSGRCAVAEYAFDEPASLPRWTLPEQTEVVVTENRVAFVDPAGQTGGELHWLWPQHLRVQPGNRDTGRSATVTQIQLVCGGPAGAFPALVFAGGDLATVSDADRLANVLRQAIARFRVENTAELGLTLPQSRMLSRLVIGPEFSNYQGGEGQTVSLLGALPVELPSAPEPFLDDYFAAGAHPSSPYAPPSGSFASAGLGPEAYGAPDSYWAATPLPDRYDSPAADPYAGPSALPTPAAGPTAAVLYSPAPAAPAGQSHHADPAPPDLASRAADLAARVASLVAGSAGLDPLSGYETQTTNLSAFLGPSDPYASATEYRYSDEVPAVYGAGDGHDTGAGYDAVDRSIGAGWDDASSDGTDRAEALRRTAARFTGNSGRARGTAPRRSDDDLNAPSPGPRSPERGYRKP